MIEQNVPPEPSPPLSARLALVAFLLQEIHAAGPGPLRESLLEHSETTLALALQLGLLDRLPAAVEGGSTLIQATAIGRSVGEAQHLHTGLLRETVLRSLAAQEALRMRPVAWELAAAVREPRRVVPAVRLEEVEQRDGSARYAIRQGGNCLGVDGQWDWEPQPSSRDAEFMARCRFDTPEQALAAWCLAKLS